MIFLAKIYVLPLELIAWNLSKNTCSEKIKKSIEYSSEHSDKIFLMMHKLALLNLSPFYVCSVSECSYWKRKFLEETESVKIIFPIKLSRTVTAPLHSTNFRSRELKRLENSSNHSRILFEEQLKNISWQLRSQESNF